MQNAMKLNQVMIENRLRVALIAMFLAAACHRGSSSMQREQKNYDVVSEGQASGVSSTISAPGEIAPPVTNTGADTTSNFTLSPNVDPTATTPATIAGTLPSTGPTNIPAPPRRVIITNTKPPRPAPPSTETEAPPPQTDTTATEHSDDQEEPEEAPRPPPPTQTDTRGW
jgi:outer membrane biosynthesis protein TonB